MRFELFIAARYLRAKRRQAVVGVITVISIAGVAAGVASLIVALAINNGFRQDLEKSLIRSTAHISLMRVESDGIRHWRELTAEMEKQPHVVAAAPALYEEVLLSRGARSGGALLKGIVPESENRVSDLLKTVQWGSASGLSPEGGADSATSPNSANHDSVSLAPYPPIVIGRDLADRIGATVGTVINAISPQGDTSPIGILPKYQQFKVIGIFKSGFYDYDSSWAFIRLQDAQQLFSLADIATVIELKVDDIYKVGEISNEVERAAGQGFMTRNWMEQNQALFRALRLERVVTFITIGLIVLVAALNILIALIMMVMEKTRDIAVLMSLGVRRRQVRRLFMLQGVLIGIIGTALGLVVGYVLSWLGGHYHWISLSAEVYSIDYVPFAARPVDGILVAAVALVISLVATLYPSWSAARILPAEALRYE
ncbi:MAG TPA: FtsX-like permease family protein [Terriglobales bacterium]